MRFTASAPDAVVFVADAQRDLWGEWDYGNFHTVPGFPTPKECPIDKPVYSRAALGISESAFVMSMTGTFCWRKQQLWGIEGLKVLLANNVDAYLLLLGSPSEAGGRGDDEYAGMVQNAVSTPPLSDRVKIVPFDFCNTNYLSIVDLHLSASTHEAYPLNTLEAMDRAVPVVATAAGGTAEQFIDPRTHWMVVHNLTNGGEFLNTVHKAHAHFAEGKLAEYGRILKSTTAEKAPARFTQGFQKIMTLVMRETSSKSMCKMWTPAACLERPGEPPEILGTPPRWHRGYNTLTWYEGYLSQQYSPPLISSVNLPDPVPFPAIGLPEDSIPLLGLLDTTIEGEASLRLLSAKARLSVSSQPSVFANSPDFPYYISGLDTGESDLAMMYAANFVLVNESDSAKLAPVWATNASRKIMYGSRGRSLFSGVRMTRVPLSKEGGFDLQPGGQVDVGIGDVSLTRLQLQALQEVGGRNTGKITVHGKFTESVLQRHGIQNAISTGCPSLMMNPRTDLGGALAAKFKQLGSSPLEKKSCRIAVMLPSYWAPKLIRAMLSMVQLCSSATILTRKHDADILEKVQKHVHSTGRHNFLPVISMDDVELSLVELRKLDLVISAQAIGGTLALMAETPAIVISSDWATKEVAEVMHLPSTNIFDHLLSPTGENQKVGHQYYQILISKIASEFDGVAFDANRHQIAKKYITMMKAVGVVPSVEIQALAISPVPSASEERHGRSRIPTLARPLFHFSIEHSGNTAVQSVLSKYFDQDSNPQRAIIMGHTDVPDWVLMRGSADNPEMPLWRDRVACATVFSGGFDALYIAWLLVKVDRGDFGEPKCRRWVQEQVDTEEEQALKIIVRNSMCAGIIREPATVVYGYWNHYLATSAHGVCTDQNTQLGCVKSAFHDAMQQLGTADVVKKCQGNLLLRRFGSSAIYGNDDDASSRFRRAKMILTACSRGRVLRTESNVHDVLVSLAKVLQINTKTKEGTNVSLGVGYLRFGQKNRFKTEELVSLKRELQMDYALYSLLNRTNSLEAADALLGSHKHTHTHTHTRKNKALSTA
jgi:hypothetical protein